MKKNKHGSGWLAFLVCVMGAVVFSTLLFAAEKPSPGRMLTEQEIATEKFFSSLEGTLAKKFFDYRKRPVIRVAIFDFTDSDGNVVKSGRDLADKISWRLYAQPQFEVVSRERVQRYMNWMGMSTLGKLDAEGLLRFQKRINTMDPANGIQALITGEVQKSVGRSLRISLSIINFQFKIGCQEREKNVIDQLSIAADIPLPTEQAVQEATEIIVRKEIRPWEEGRLLVLVNNRGNDLLETEFVQQFKKEKPFSWNVPFLFTVVREEAGVPRRVKVALNEMVLNPIPMRTHSPKDAEYSFINGMCMTNEVYFDNRVPVQSYQLLTSFGDPRTNEIFSGNYDVKVFADTTTVVVLTYYIPGEKERFRTKQIPRTRVHQLSGKGMEIGLK